MCELAVRIGPDMRRGANQDSQEAFVVESKQKKWFGIKTAQISCGSGRSGAGLYLKHSPGASEELKSKRSLPATVRSMMSALFCFFFWWSGLPCRSCVSQRSGEAANMVVEGGCSLLMQGVFCENIGLQRKHACFRFCALPDCAQLSRVIVPRIPV